jgi:hypothetical protein
MMTMRTPDTRVLPALVFCYLAASAAGCGDNSKQRPSDAAADSARDTNADSPPTVDALQDSSTPSPDAAVDTVADLSPSPDSATPDAALDSKQGDAPQVDAPQVDGAPASDGGSDDSEGDALTDAPPVITFHLKNTGTQTIYLHSICTNGFKVISGADGTVYDNENVCACNCSSSDCNGPVYCKLCGPSWDGVPINTGAAKELTWTAELSKTQTETGPYGSYQCYVHSPIPTGPYTVAIAVYANSADATSETNPQTFETSFTLGTDNATVEVPLQ